MIKLLKKLYFYIRFRGDEFHKSLDLDLDKYVSMNCEQRKAYLAHLARMRDTAHYMDIKEF